MFYTPLARLCVKRLFFLLTVAGVLNNYIAGCLQNRVLTLHFKF